MKQWMVVGLGVFAVACGGTDPSITPLSGPAPSEDGGAVGEEAAATSPDGGAPAADAGGSCVPHCAPGANCGVADDVCGTGKIQCGACAAPDTCGGGGKANACGCKPFACVPGATCGTLPDNCGGTEDCGACNGDDLCHAGGCLTLESLGCVHLAAGQLTPPCPNPMPPGEPQCVRRLYNGGGGDYDLFACPSSSVLPTDACQQHPKIPTIWNCD